jgi:hypothetical protein
VLFFACLIFIFHHTECGVVGVLILCLSPPFECADQVLGLFALEIRGRWSGHQGEPWTGFFGDEGLKICHWGLLILAGQLFLGMLT